MKRGLPLLAALLVLLPAAGRAEVYKCRLADGRIEISNTGCANSSTLSVRRDETVSPENRARAEREVEQMREYVEQREAAGRSAPSTTPPPARPSVNPPSAPPPPPAAIEECLRDLERQAMEADKRAEMEASCRSTAKAQPVADGQPIYVVGSGGVQCLRAVERLNLSPQERARRIEHCQGRYVPPPSPKITQPARPAAAAHALCPPGQLNCGR